MSAQSLRIVRLANFVAPASGGLRTALRELGKGFKAAGHEPVLIVPGESVSDRETEQGRVITLPGPLLPGTGGYRVLTDKRRVAQLLEELAPDRLEVSDHAAGTVLSWPAGLPRTVVSSPEQPATFHGRWSLYFYVPKGTREVGGYASGAGAMLDGSGKVVHTFEARPGYFSVAVPAGQDGRLWKMERCVGQRLLMTVPPCLAASARELLLPVEVVRKDAR